MGELFIFQLQFKGRWHTLHYFSYIITTILPECKYMGSRKIMDFYDKQGNWVDYEIASTCFTWRILENSGKHDES